MSLDTRQYLPYLEGIDLPLAQKEEMIRTVWGLMESQVDQAFNQHPLQDNEQISKKCSQLDQSGIESELMLTTHHSVSQDT